MACSNTHVAPEIHASPPAGREIELVNDYETLLRLKPSWDELLKQADANHPYISHEWICTWWDCFGADKSLYVLLVKEAGELRGIAPLISSRERLNGLPVRRLGTLYNPHTGRCDFIVARDAAWVYRAIWGHLRQNKKEWDVLELCHLPAGSETLHAIPELAKEDGFPTGAWESVQSPFVRTGRWDEYYDGLPRKHRSNLRNRLKRLGKLGHVGFEELSSIEDVRRALPDGLRIEAASWKGKAGTAILNHPQTLRFYTQLAEKAGERGWLRLYFLSVNQKRIAFAYSFQYEDRIFLHKIGYDPDYYPFSPMNLLCLHILTNAFSRGLSEFDFIGEGDEWKLRWTDNRRPHLWFYVFSKSLFGKFLHAIKFRLLPWMRERWSRKRLPAPTPSAIKAPAILMMTDLAGLLEPLLKAA